MEYPRPLPTFIRQLTRRLRRPQTQTTRSAVCHRPSAGPSLSGGGKFVASRTPWRTRSLSIIYTSQNFPHYYFHLFFLTLYRSTNRRFGEKATNSVSSTSFCRPSSCLDGTGNLRAFR